MHKTKFYNIQQDYASHKDWKLICIKDKDIKSSVLIETDNYNPIMKFDGKDFIKITTQSTYRKESSPDNADYKLLSDFFRWC